MGDVNSYYDAFNIPIDKQLFSAVMFELDDLFLDYQYKKNKPKGGKGKQNQAIPIW